MPYDDWEIVEETDSLDDWEAVEPTAEPDRGFLGNIAQDITTFGKYIPQGLSLGWSDELARELQAPFIGRERAEAIRQEKLAELAGLHEESPAMALLGETTGAIAPVIAGAGLAPQAGKAYAASKPLRTAAGLGALSGGVYGAGTSDPEEERMRQAAISAGVGGVAGPAGSLVGQRVLGPLARKAQGLFKKAPQVADDLLPTDIAARQDILPAAPEKAGAYGKVQKALKKDFPDFENVLKAYKDGDISLAELHGSQSASLAQGAAQYPGGKAKALEFFDPAIEGSYDRVIKTISRDISDIDNYFMTADDLVNAGRVKAAPFYEEAYEQSIDLADELPKEIQTAIAKARRQFPSELEGMEDNSVKVLDYAKRVLDDDIGAAQRAGRGNLARSRTMVKNDLLAQIDEAVPSYKKARAQSGDYLSINEAMETGRKALKTDPEILAQQFKSLTDAEKNAYKIGLGKAVRDEAGKVAEGANPYRRVMGTPEKKRRLSAVLSPKQYKKLEQNLKTEDRLFKLRNEVIGGSPTSEKQMNRALIASGVETADQIAQLPRKGFVNMLKLATDGMDDKTATKVSEILYEKDPVRKLAIIDKLSKNMDFTVQERQAVKRVYFELADQFDPFRMGAVGSAPVSGRIEEGFSE